ncbi:SDR family oxidoreductase [uncultured Gilvimarinus sp.]|uniref:SDR family oxidoreductase n=1 Tax=uncultured Gilvimarinus sp. TaxID=1689143 RepID=UPI0030DC8F09
MSLFRNKLIVLTGATGGIGQALGRQLAAQGATLMLVGRNRKCLDELDTTLQVQANGGLTVVADLATEAGRATLKQAVRSFARPVDILINGVGASCFGTLEQLSDVEIERTIHTNVLTPILITRALLAELNPSGASIVNIGSVFGSIGFPGFSLYCASKFALRGFNEALRRELADRPIDVHYIAPRATRTAMNSDSVNAMNRELNIAMDSPDCVAAACLKTISKKRKERYIGWPERLFVKLNQCWPAIVDMALARQLPTVRRYAQRQESPPRSEVQQ